mmetsp:Transcript_4752/g.6123  ORF Transcript_4752/g.6123 Transcript_4752/m.6123 type:complete len:132 (-) Transcript_4752:12-407(-)
MGALALMTACALGLKVREEEVTSVLLFGLDTSRPRQQSLKPSQQALTPCVPSDQARHWGEVGPALDRSLDPGPTSRFRAHRQRDCDGEAFQFGDKGTVNISAFYFLLTKAQTQVGDLFWLESRLNAERGPE